MLFTTEISEKEQQLASGIEQELDTLSKIFNNIIDTFEKNLNAVESFQGQPSELLKIKPKLVSVVKEQKEKYEKFLLSLRDAMNKLKGLEDIEIHEIKETIAQEAERFTKLFNNYLQTSEDIGKNNFIEDFKNDSKNILQAENSFNDVLTRAIKHINKNILGKQAIS